MELKSSRCGVTNTSASVLVPVISTITGRAGGSASLVAALPAVEDIVPGRSRQHFLPTGSSLHQPLDVKLPTMSLLFREKPMVISSQMGGKSRRIVPRGFRVIPDVTS